MDNIADYNEGIHEIFEEATLTMSYKLGIKKAEKLMGKYNSSREISSRSWEELGFLYDHAGFQTKNPIERKKLERKAFLFYKKSLTKNQKNINAVWGIARIWWHRKSKRALSYAIQAYRMHKKTTRRNDFGGNVGLIYESLGKYKKAAEWYMKTLKTTRRSDIDARLVIYSHLTRLYYHQKELQKLRYYQDKSKKLYDVKDLKFKRSATGRFLLRSIQHPAE